MKKTDVLLDLLPDVEPDMIEVAHDSEKEKEEKEEIEQGPIKVKRSRKTSEEEDDDSKFWEYVKYGAIAGFAVLIVELIIARHRRNRKGKGPDMQEMMMLMMYQTMMVQMQNIQQQNHKESLPPQIVTDDNTKFNTDWSEWFKENGGKEIKKFGSSKSSVLNKMHVAENWKVRRDLNGKILDVSKTNEYIR